MATMSAQRVWHRVEAPGTLRGHAMEADLGGRRFRAWEDQDGSWRLQQAQGAPLTVDGDWSEVRRLADRMSRGPAHNPVHPLVVNAAAAGAAIAMRNALGNPASRYELAAARADEVRRHVPLHWVTAGIGIRPDGIVTVRVRPGYGARTRQKLQVAGVGFPVQIEERDYPRARAALPNPPPVAPALVVDTLGALQAAYLIYRQAHWQVSGVGYYGQHQLLERIYKESEEHVDDWAEQMVGSFGSASVELEGNQMEAINRAVRAFESESDPLRRSLRAAMTVREYLDNVYADLKRSGDLTLGWDDLVMSISREKDKHVYLLQQALGVAPQERKGHLP